LRFEDNHENFPNTNLNDEKKTLDENEIFKKNHDNQSSFFNESKSPNRFKENNETIPQQNNKSKHEKNLEINEHIEDSVFKNNSFRASYEFNDNNLNSYKSTISTGNPTNQNIDNILFNKNTRTNEELHNNIPILNKLLKSSDNIDFESKKNFESSIEKITENNQSELNQNSNVLINENPQIEKPKIIQVMMSDIDPKLKFEKLLNTNLDAKLNFRICIVGDSNVGKTSLLTRYCDDTFKISMTNTIGVDFRVLMLRYNDMNIKLQIWDTAGQERFKSISVNYFKSANGFIFVYDIANRLTFESLDNWFEIVQQHNKNSVCNFVIGNKCDLEERRQVSVEEGRDFAFSKKFNFMETSAKSSKNVDMAFEIFTIKMMEYFNIENPNIMQNADDSNSSIYSLEDGKKFKIDDIYDENTMSKKKKRGKCKC